ncbi:hypothetical protein CPB83DRAFT_849289 [Crepidotus variabilis]|uniref:Uncharacterized protein n=1 Tax=Crepidotus variabilis TaxID=179855 RepID=A0A9P6JS91_9AGAR|nr:hypothetical protein CPB83DRAFT_849289 [Crepidotus variabilis]
MTNPGSQRTPLKKSQNPNVEYFLARQVLGIFKAVDGIDESAAGSDDGYGMPNCKIAS